MPREWVAATVWPDSDMPRETLRRTLTDLRNALGDCADALVADHQNLCLRILETNVDVLTFDTLVQSNDPAAWEQAISLYQGPLMPECDDLWSNAHRIRRTDSYIAVLERLAARMSVQNKPASSLPYLRRAIAADPYREKLHRDLMTNLAACGELSEAILAYRNLRSVLHEATRSEPSPETIALYHQIRSAVPQKAARISSPASAGSSAVEATVNRLPRPLTRLLGRDENLHALQQSFPNSRLVTIVGAGGIGKTRLAIEAATRLENTFADGVRFVDLAPISEPGLVVQAVARVFDIREEKGNNLTRSLVDTLRSRHHLLVIDNCEHVIDSCARLIHVLLNDCPQLCILATSRQPLRLSGELIHPLRPLSLPEQSDHWNTRNDSTRIDEVLLRSAALQLFVERITAFQPEFVVTPQNLSTVIEICCKLDGIPLALELAAARTRSLSVEQIADRLHQRFRLLSGGDRTVPERQQSLKALLDWSYQLLDAEEKKLLGRCSIFAGGWTLETATALCQADIAAGPSTVVPENASWEVLDRLDSLVEKSLILAQPSTNGSPRYRMLETIREYALERLTETGEGESLRTRHVEWFIDLAEAAEAAMRGPNQAQALQRVEIEEDNLRLALQTATTGQQRMRLATALFWHWYVHGRYGEGRRWLESTLAETSDVPPLLRSRALKALGDLCWALGDLDAARRKHEENLCLQQEAHDERGITVTLNSLGLVAYHQSDCTTAADYYRRSLEHARSLGDPYLTASLLVNFALVKKELGSYTEAATMLSESELLFRQLGNKQGLGKVLHTLSLLAKRQGDYDRARQYAEETIEIDREVNDTKGWSTGQHTLGEIAFLTGDQDEAERRYLMSLEGFRQVGAQRFIAVTLTSLGEIARIRGQEDRAWEYLRESMRIQIGVGDRLAMANTLCCAAFLELRRNQPGQAAHLLGAVATESQRLKIPLLPNQQEQYDCAVQSIRDILGSSAFEIAFGQGRAMAIDTAAAYSGLL
jgi:predicted ATPase/DNA-binding SARP family transcriptional activator